MSALVYEWLFIHAQLQMFKCPRSSLGCLFGQFFGAERGSPLLLAPAPVSWLRSFCPTVGEDSEGGYLSSLSQ